MIDNVESAYRLAEHLISHGYRRIAALFGIANTTGRERRKGFVQALHDHALEPDPQLVSYVNAREEDGYQATLKLLALPDRPEAIFTSNGLLATGTFRALRESGLAIPNEIAFATFDDNNIFVWKPFLFQLQQSIKHWAKPATLALSFGVLSDLTRSRADLIVENALLHQQLIVLHRQVKRPVVTNRDRFCLVLLARCTRFWEQALHIVQPDTLLR